MGGRRGEFTAQPPLIRSMSVFLQLVVLSALITTGLARRKPKLASAGTFKGRTFSASTSAPFSAQFNKDPQGKAALAGMLALLETERQKHATRRANWVYSADATEEYPCNTIVTEKIEQALNNSLFSRGFGQLGKPCVADIRLKLGAKTESQMLAYFSAVNAAKAGVLDATRAIMRQAGRVWKKAYTFSKFEYHDDFQDCSLYHLTAFHVRGRWAASADITNAPPSAEMKDRERWYLAENIYLDDRNQVRALPMVAKGYPNVKEEVRGTTTTFANWAGWPAASRFTDVMTPGNNPAVRAAISGRLQEREQAEDSSTKSNIAILVLPLATALIPISTFADVSKFVALAYLLITDVAAMMPFAIKGMELLWFSHEKQDATILRFYGAVSKEQIGAAELWHAKCSTLGHLKVQGAVFLSAAIFFMVTGVVLEVVLWMRLKRKKRLAVKMGNDKPGEVQLWEKLGLNITDNRCECCLLSSSK